MYREKEKTKKVYNNIMNLIKLLNRLNAIFMSSENSKPSNTYRLLINLSNKINFKKIDK